MSGDRIARATVLPLEVYPGSACPVLDRSDPRVSRLARPDAQGLLLLADLLRLPPGSRVVLTGFEPLASALASRLLRTLGERGLRATLFTPLRPVLPHGFLAAEAVVQLIPVIVRAQHAGAMLRLWREEPLLWGKVPAVLLLPEQSGDARQLGEMLRELAEAVPDATLQLEAQGLPAERLAELADSLSRWYPEARHPARLVVSGLPPCLLSGRLRAEFLQRTLPEWLRVLYFSGERPPVALPLDADRAAYAQVAACEGCARANACPGLLGGESSPLREEIRAIRAEAVPLPLLPPHLLEDDPPARDFFVSRHCRFGVHYTLQVEIEALLAGLKPRYRSVLSEEQLAQKVRLLEEAGVAWYSPGARMNEDLSQNRMAPGEAANKRILYAGGSADSLRRMAELDLALLSANLPLPEQVELTRELGRLLGYPECCIAAYQVLGERQNRVLAEQGLAAVLACGQQPSWMLNNLSPTVLALLPWIPCSYRCAESLRRVTALWEMLCRQSASQTRQIEEFLRLPRWFRSEREQVHFEELPEARGSYRWWLPFHTDQHLGTLGVEVEFWRQLPFREHPVLGLDLESGAVLLEGGRRVLPQECDALWFRFG